MYDIYYIYIQYYDFTYIKMGIYYDYYHYILI